MKLTNEDLRKIILEEIEAVLSEDYPQLDNSESGLVPDAVSAEKDKPPTQQDFSSDLLQLAKDIKTNPELKKTLTPQKLIELEKFIQLGMQIATDPENRSAHVDLGRANDYSTKFTEK